MDLATFEFLGGLLAGTLGLLTVMIRTGHLTVVLTTGNQTPITMPMLAVRKPRTASPVRRRSISPPTKKGRSTATVVRTRRKAKNKTPEATAALGQMPDIAAAATMSFDTCPSCGLQAPGSLLTEHFLQMLVPPRAFGRRHAHKSVSPISPIVEYLGPASGRIHRL